MFSALRFRDVFDLGPTLQVDPNLEEACVPPVIRQFDIHGGRDGVLVLVSVLSCLPDTRCAVLHGAHHRSASVSMVANLSSADRTRFGILISFSLLVSSCSNA